MASSTLDASAKIYAGRVDAVHSDMFKVLGGLGVSNKNEGEDDDDADRDPDHPASGSKQLSPSQKDHEKAKRKRKKVSLTFIQMKDFETLPPIFRFIFLHKSNLSDVNLKSGAEFNVFRAAVKSEPI